MEDAIEKAENYSRRECVILQFLPPLLQDQTLFDQIYQLIRILYPDWNPNISWKAIHYLGPQRNPNRPPPAILKFSFRSEKEEFFQRFIHTDNNPIQNSDFATTRISNSLSKTSLLRRSMLLSHHIHLRNLGEPSSLRETCLKLHGIVYTIDYRTGQISPEPTWSLAQVEIERQTFLESRAQQQQQLQWPTRNNTVVPRQEAPQQEAPRQEAPRQEAPQRNQTNVPLQINNNEEPQVLVHLSPPIMQPEPNLQPLKSLADRLKAALTRSSQ